MSKQSNEQAELATAIGFTVVGCGHLEHHLRRTLVWLRGLPPGSIAPIRKLGWSPLIREIRDLAATRHGAGAVLDLFDEYDVDRLKIIRGNLIHGCVWLDMAPSLYVARHPSSGPSSVVVGSANDVWTAMPAFFQLARSMDAVIPEEGWTRANAVRPEWAEDGAPAPPAGPPCRAGCLLIARRAGMTP
jgi:hypothetical protein